MYLLNVLLILKNESNVIKIKRNKYIALQIKNINLEKFTFYCYVFLNLNLYLILKTYKY